MDFLESEINHDRPDLIAVSETWFRKESLVDISGFVLCRADRTNGRRGVGVAIYVNKELTSYEAPEEFSRSQEFESMWIVVENSSTKTLIGCVYQPGQCTENNQLYGAIKQACATIDSGRYNDMLLVGDLNFPSITWQNRAAEEVRISEGSTELDIINLLQDEYLIQHHFLPFSFLKGHLQTH